jgi:HAE1 family hydrophobic/amphiphilic exporter-1
MSLPRLALKRPVTVSMVCVSLFVMGLIASRMLPLEMFPEFDAPFLFISAPYPNASPSEVEQEIIRPLEETLATVPGVQRLRSWSAANGGRVFMEFQFGQDLAIKAVEVRDRLEAVRGQLPDDVRNINVFKFATTDQPVLELVISSSGRNLRSAFDLLERELVRRIERLQGVSRVELEGVERNQIHIDLLADRLSAHGIDALTLQGQLQRANFVMSAGRQTLDGQRWQVKPVGDFSSTQDFADFVINDSGLRLSDVAEVRFAPERRTSERRLNGQTSVGVSIYRERGANLVAISRAVQAELDRIMAEPAMQGIEVYKFQDQARSVTTSLKDLLLAGLVGGVLSLLVLYGFLRNFRLTAMIALAVPVSLTVALGGLYFAGISLNILSMMGLMLAIGMLVDNAVVVSESILSERERAPDDPMAVARGASSVSVAVIAGTLTTAIVFVPNIFGDASNVSLFLRDVAVTICLALGASLLLAQTLIPVVAGRLPVRSTEHLGWMGKLRHGYGAFLRWSLPKRWRMLTIVFLTLVSVWIPMSSVQMAADGEGGDRFVSLNYHIDAEYPLDVVAEAVDSVEGWLLENQEQLGIEAVLSSYSERGRARSLLVFKSEGVDLAAKRAEIRENLPAIAIGAPSFEWRSNRTDRAMTVYLYGDATAELVRQGEEVADALRRLSSVAAVTPESAGGDSQVLLSVQRERALGLGLSSADVGRSVAAAMRGSQLREIAGPNGDIPVRFGFRDADSQRMDQLADFRLPTPSGFSVPLAAITDWQIEAGPRTIARTNRETTLALEIELAEGEDGMAGRQQIPQLLNGMSWPEGYGWRFGRNVQQDQDDIRQMMINLLLAIVFIFMIMAALFESMARPLAILSTIAFAIVGTWWFFLLTGTSMSLVGLIGVLVLVGVVVNNGIVLIDHINRFRWQGMERQQAIILAGQERLRPILLTSLTTIIGMLPLAWGDTRIAGDGPPYYPMARAIVGGLAFSTVFTLVFLPVIYLFVEDAAAWLRRVGRWLSGSGRGLAPATDQAK